MQRQRNGLLNKSQNLCVTVPPCLYLVQPSHMIGQQVKNMCLHLVINMHVKYDLKLKAFIFLVNYPFNIMHKQVLCYKITNVK